MHRQRHFTRFSLSLTHKSKAKSVYLLCESCLLLVATGAPISSASSKSKCTSYIPMSSRVSSEELQPSQYHEPTGMSSKGGSRHSRWNPRSQPSHRSMRSSRSHEPHISQYVGSSRISTSCCWVGGSTCCLKWKTLVQKVQKVGFGNKRVCFCLFAPLFSQPNLMKFSVVQTE